MKVISFKETERRAFAIFKHRHLPAHFLFCWTLTQCFGRGMLYFIFLSGGNCCMCVVTCGCCVFCQLNLTGWEGGRGEQRAWTPSPLKSGFWARKRSSEEFVQGRPSGSHCTWIYVRLVNVLQDDGGHGTVHFWLAWTFAMSEPCSRTKEWSFQFKREESNTVIVCMCVHSQWCSSVGMLKENTTVDHSACVPHIKAIPQRIALMVWFGVSIRPRTLLEPTALVWMSMNCVSINSSSNWTTDSLPVIYSKLLLDWKVYNALQYRHTA